MDSGFFNAVGGGSDAGCVGQGYISCGKCAVLCDPVACCAGMIVNDGATIAEQCVEECGFAGVYRAGERDGISLVELLCGVVECEQGVDVVLDADDTGVYCRGLRSVDILAVLKLDDRLAVGYNRFDG